MSNYVFVIVREIFNPNVERKTELEHAFHSLNNAKAWVYDVMDKIANADTEVTTTHSHEQWNDGDFLVGFTAMNGQGICIQTARIERVKLSERCIVQDDGPN